MAKLGNPYVWEMGLLCGQKLISCSFRPKQEIQAIKILEGEESYV